MPTPTPNYFPLIFVAVIGWRVYRRIRRSIGRQPVRRNRMITGIVIYSVLTVLVALLGIQHPMVIAGLGGGLVVGVPLGLVGLHFTKFENTPQGRFYTSHPYIGVSIAALLVVRMFYRMSMLMGGQSQAQSNPAALQSPLTFSIFGLLAGYYITFYAGVLIRSAKVPLAPQSP
jgi:hypothetical protein